MAGQPGLFDRDRRDAALAAAGDPLGRLALAIDVELFRAALEAALARSDRAKGGRPPYDAVLMFKVLVHETNGQYTQSRLQNEAELEAAAAVEVRARAGAERVGSGWRLGSRVEACCGACMPRMSSSGRQAAL